MKFLIVGLILFSAACHFFNDYPDSLFDGLRDVRVNEGYRKGFFRWNWDIIEMQRCEEDIFIHELTHFVMKRNGWTLARSQKHDFTFDGTQKYIEEVLEMGVIR